LLKHSLPIRDEFVVQADWTREGGYLAMRALLALDSPPTAIFCANDLMAIGAIDAARQAGIRIPDDIAVVGVDDIDAAGLISPALTTVQIPAEEIGKVAGELLIRRLSEEVDLDSPPRHVLVQHRLVARESD
jgi:LacI family transcriptional regulator